MSATKARAAKTAFVARLFARIAPRYDLMNHLMTAGLDQGWRRRACELLGPLPALPVLDVGAGTADLSLSLAERRPGTRIVGLDLTPAMLALGKRKVATQGEERTIGLVRGDGLVLPFRDSSLGAAISAFTLRNVADPTQALREMRRVVVPGGCVLVLELSQPRAPLFAPLFHLYFNRLVPLLGAVVAHQRAAYTYLPASVEAFLSPQGLARAMEEAGLVDVAVTSLACGAATIHAGRRPDAH